MNVLFIGGTGIISSACTRLALQRGIGLTLLTRGQHSGECARGPETANADISDAPAVKRALHGRRFDPIVNWIAFTPADTEPDPEIFRGRTRPSIFIRSA